MTTFRLPLTRCGEMSIDVNLENGTTILTGLLGMLVRKEADVAVGSFYLLVERLKYIDYSAILQVQL